MKGGKNYKKGKKGGQETVADLYTDREPDQMFGRIIRPLGNLNMLVYCNDNVLRICKVCGKMRKRVFVETGDLVLCSIRDFRSGTKEKEEASKVEKGDILAKYCQEHYSKLRKEDGINPKLFMKIETMNGMTISEVGTEKNEIVDSADDGIVFEDDSEEEGKEEDEIDIDKI